MQTIVVRESQRHSAIGLSRRKHDELSEVARRWQEGRRRYLVMYWDPVHAADIVRSIQSFAHRHGKERGWGEVALPDHQARLALESALALIKSNWRTTIAQVGDLITRNEQLSKEQRHWLRYVLRSTRHLRDCLRGRTAFLDKPWSDELDEHDLSRYLRRMLLRYRAGMPRRSKRLWFQVDTNLYRPIDRTGATSRHRQDRKFRGAWISISGLARSRRVLVPLTGEGLAEFSPRTSKENSRPGLIVEVGDRILFRVPIRHVVTKRMGAEAGLDKGFRTLLTVSRGDPESVVTFGEGASSTITELAESSLARTRQRRRLVAYERSLRNSVSEADRGKARRIRRANLGALKTGRRGFAEKMVLREQIGRALNEMFRLPIATLHVEALRFGDRRLPRRVNRRLRRWLQGYLHQRLVIKAELNGVELNVVNASWTSLTCPRCWFTSKSNRNVDRFTCQSCDYTGSADAIAATNVLRRGSDPAITRGTSRVEVLHILLGRWRSALSDGAWSSNERSLSEDGAESNGLDRAANNDGAASLSVVAPVPLLGASQSSPQ